MSEKNKPFSYVEIIRDSDWTVIKRIDVSGKTDAKKKRLLQNSMSLGYDIKSHSFELNDYDIVQNLNPILVQ